MPRIMGVDFGDARTGLALSDETGLIASPIGKIDERNMRRCALDVSRKANEYNVSRIVLGYPKNMNGTVGPRALKTEQFARILREDYGLDVVLFDERLTTSSAHSILAHSGKKGKDRKDILDTLSASVLLQNYLDSVRPTACPE